MKIAMVFPTRESEKAISGYSVTLVDSIKQQGEDISNINYTAGSPFNIFKKFKEIKKYDVVHIQHEYNLLGGYGLPFFALYFLFSFCKCRVITTMHTVLSKKEKFKGSKLKTFFRKFLYFTQNRVINWCSDMVVVHAEFFKDILVKEYNFSPSKIAVLPQGIIENVPSYDKLKTKKELKLSGPVYLFMGSMVPDHGHDIIINQADKIGGTTLVVANPGSVNDRNTDRVRDYIEENKQIVKQKKLEKFVRFDIFDITDKNPLWWKYFAAADLVLLPYRGGIGSGIFAHSIAAKRPIIVSNIKFFNEASRHFKGIAIAKDDEDYPRVIKDSIKPRNLKRMEQECVNYLKENGLSAIARKYKKIYHALK
ncbi:MAG: glycosyltransferase [Nanoarchaeota archaeon]